MKLLTKTTLYYILVALPLVVLASIISFRLIKSEMREGTDEALKYELHLAKDLIKKGLVKQKQYLSIDSLSFVEPSFLHNSKKRIADTLIYDKYEKEYVLFRKLTSYYTANEASYCITILKTTIEEDELIEGVLSTFFIIVGLLTIAFLFSNWILSRSIWKPFYKTLNELKRYDIKNHEKSNFSTSNTLEFNQLNDTLNTLINKIYQDYIQQKEFTENASHELQTPIAIIKANINLLMQSSNIKEHEMEQLQIIDDTLKKISSLNKALLLLTKIENHQFHKTEQINISNVLYKIVDNIQELADAKDITIKKQIQSNVCITMNAMLSEIIILNILQNAIRHNIKGGCIEINLSDTELIVSNSGEPLNINPEELFIRFKKNDASKDSVGLGLAIVKSISDLYHFKINYHFNNSQHYFTLKFS